MADRPSARGRLPVTTHSRLQRRSAMLMAAREHANGRRSPARADIKPDGNVGDTERWISVAGGGLLVLVGLSRRSLAGLTAAGVGAGLIYRGLTGHCHVFS